MVAKERGEKTQKSKQRYVAPPTPAEENVFFACWDKLERRQGGNQVTRKAMVLLIIKEGGNGRLSECQCHRLAQRRARKQAAQDGVGISLSPVTGKRGRRYRFNDETCHEFVEESHDLRMKGELPDESKEGNSRDRLLRMQEQVFIKNSKGVVWSHRLARKIMGHPCEKTIRKTLKSRIGTRTAKAQKTTDARKKAAADPLNPISLYLVLSALLASIPSPELWQLVNFDVSGVNIVGETCTFVEYVPLEGCSTRQVPLQTSSRSGRKMGYMVKFVAGVTAEGIAAPIVVLFYDKSRDPKRTKKKKKKKKWSCQGTIKLQAASTTSASFESDHGPKVKQALASAAKSARGKYKSVGQESCNIACKSSDPPAPEPEPAQSNSGPAPQPAQSSSAPLILDVAAAMAAAQAGGSPLVQGPVMSDQPAQSTSSPSIFDVEYTVSVDGISKSEAQGMADRINKSLVDAFKTQLADLGLDSPVSVTEECKLVEEEVTAEDKGDIQDEQVQWIRVEQLSRPGIGGHGYIAILNHSQPGRRFWRKYHEWVIIPFINELRELYGSKQAQVMPQTPQKAAPSASSAATPTGAAVAVTDAETSPPGGTEPAPASADTGPEPAPTTPVPADTVTTTRPEPAATAGPGSPTPAVDSPAAESTVEETRRSCDHCSNWINYCTVNQADGSRTWQCGNCSNSYVVREVAPAGSVEPDKSPLEGERGQAIVMFDGEARQLGVFTEEELRDKYREEKIYAVKLAASCSSTQQACDVGVFFMVIKKKSRGEHKQGEDARMTRDIIEAMTDAKKNPNLKHPVPKDADLVEFAKFCSRLPALLEEAMTKHNQQSAFQKLGLDVKHCLDTGDLRMDLETCLDRSDYEFTDEEVENIKTNLEALISRVALDRKLSEKTIKAFNLPIGDEEKADRARAAEAGRPYNARDNGNRVQHQGRVQVCDGELLRQFEQDRIQREKEQAEAKEKKEQADAEKRKQKKDQKSREQKLVEDKAKAISERRASVAAADTAEKKAVALKKAYEKEKERADKLEEEQERAYHKRQVLHQRLRESGIYVCDSCTKVLEDGQGCNEPCVSCSTSGCEKWTCLECAGFESVDEVSGRFHCLEHKPKTSRTAPAAGSNHGSPPRRAPSKGKGKGKGGPTPTKGAKPTTLHKNKKR